MRSRRKRNRTLIIDEDNREQALNVGIRMMDNGRTDSGKFRKLHVPPPVRPVFFLRIRPHSFPLVGIGTSYSVKKVCFIARI